MVEVWLPYGKTEVHISVPLKNLMGTLEPIKKEPTVSNRETVREPSKPRERRKLP